MRVPTDHGTTPTAPGGEVAARLGGRSADAVEAAAADATADVGEPDRATRLQLQRTREASVIRWMRRLRA